MNEDDCSTFDISVSCSELSNMRQIFIFLCLLPITFASLEYDGSLTIKLEHGLDGQPEPEFTERGNISIPSLRVGTAFVHQSINDEDRQKIQELARSNKYYQLKATVALHDGSYTYLSFVKACMLAESELNDIITVSLDYSGRVITITESVASTSTCQGADVAFNKLNEFTTSVYVRPTGSGPVPDTAAFIQKQERERDAKERGEVKDNRSFLAKYWMYILPVIVIMVVSSAANPEGGAAAGGR